MQKKLFTIDDPRHASIIHFLTLHEMKDGDEWKTTLDIDVVHWESCHMKEALRMSFPGRKLISIRDHIDTLRNNKGELSIIRIAKFIRKIQRETEHTCLN